MNDLYTYTQGFTRILKHYKTVKNISTLYTYNDAVTSLPVKYMEERRWQGHSFTPLSFPNNLVMETISIFKVLVDIS